MTKEEIFNYVMNTPKNTNPAVLASQLDVLVDEKEEDIPSFVVHSAIELVNDADAGIAYLDITATELYNIYSGDRAGTDYYLAVVDAETGNQYGIIKDVIWEGSDAPVQTRVALEAKEVTVIEFESFTTLTFYFDNGNDKPYMEITATG